MCHKIKRESEVTEERDLDSLGKRKVYRRIKNEWVASHSHFSLWKISTTINRYASVLLAVAGGKERGAQTKG